MMRSGSGTPDRVQASLTGHLVLAALHTNDSVSAVTFGRYGRGAIFAGLSLLGWLRSLLSAWPVCKLCHPASSAQVARLVSIGLPGASRIFELLNERALRPLITMVP
jgi:general secretion pathway protein E